MQWDLFYSVHFCNSALHRVTKKKKKQERKNKKKEIKALNGLGFQLKAWL